jgi:DNA-binding beta-propeller fold protein YncE
MSISGKDVKLIDTVPMGEQVSHVVFTPDGTRALVAKFPGHKIAVLNVDGQKVTDSKSNMNVGLWPYNVMDSDVSILKVEETKKGIRVVNTGKNFKLPGQPASMRGRNQ